MNDNTFTDSDKRKYSVLAGILTQEDVENLSRYFGVIVPPGTDNLSLKQTIQNGVERIDKLNKKCDTEVAANAVLRKERDAARLSAATVNKDAAVDGPQSALTAYHLAIERNARLRTQLEKQAARIETLQETLLKNQGLHNELHKNRARAVEERDEAIESAIGYRDLLSRVRFLIDEVERAVNNDNPQEALEHIAILWETVEPQEVETDAADTSRSDNGDAGEPAV